MRVAFALTAIVRRDVQMQTELLQDRCVISPCQLAFEVQIKMHDRNDSLNPVFLALPGNTNAIAHIQVQTDDFMRNRNNNAQLTVHTAGHVASAKTQAR